MSSKLLRSTAAGGAPLLAGVAIVLTGAAFLYKWWAVNDVYPLGGLELVEFLRLQLAFYSLIALWANFVLLPSLGRSLFSGAAACGLLVVLAFEVASVVLLAAIIGALTLMRDR